MYSKPLSSIPLHFKYSSSDFYSTYLLHDMETIQSVLKDSFADLEIDTRIINDCQIWSANV